MASVINILNTGNWPGKSSWRGNKKENVVLCQSTADSWVDKNRAQEERGHFTTMHPQSMYSRLLQTQYLWHCIFTEPHKKNIPNQSIIKQGSNFSWKLIMVTRKAIIKLLPVFMLHFIAIIQLRHLLNHLFFFKLYYFSSLFTCCVYDFLLMCYWCVYSPIWRSLCHLNLTNLCSFIYTPNAPSNIN